MNTSLETEVQLAIDSWLRWLPKWHPASVASRPRVCRKCFGSPVVKACGLDRDVPHAVQHAFVMRINKIISNRVDNYIELNLPMMQQQLKLDEQRRNLLPYRPTEGLDPEYQGLEIDPPTPENQPFLFTMAELADSMAAETVLPRSAPLTEQMKQSLRQELQLSDQYTNQLGGEICNLLVSYQSKILSAVSEFVEPQIKKMLADLTEALQLPPE